MRSSLVASGQEPPLRCKIGRLKSDFELSRMTLESMRKLFWLLLFLEALFFTFLDHATLMLLRIGEFGAKDNSEMWHAVKRMAEFALCITYLAGVVIAF